MDLKKLGETIATNAVIATLAIGCGYLFGTSEIARLEATATANSAAIVEARATLKARRAFINDTTDRVELLCRNDPECWQTYGKMERPE